MPKSLDHDTSLPWSVVVGGDYQGLGIVRSLGRLGIPVLVIDDERSIARYSRYAARFVHAPDLWNETAIVETLLEAGRRLGLEGAVLYPTRDELVAVFSRRRDVLSPTYRVPTPGWETIRWVWDKRNTYDLALSLGIPTPRTVWPADESELDSLELKFPVVIKPAIKERFIRVTRAKAWRADNPAELRMRFRAARAILPDGETMLQEYVPGGAQGRFAYCALFKNGQGIVSMHTRRRRQHPWEFGRASTFVETVEVPELEAQSVRFLRHIDYYGLVEVEYQQDARDGLFKLLDVNARTWGYHTLGSGAGIDFSGCLYHDQMGLEVERGRARPGVTWVRALTDVPTGLADIFGRRTDLRSYLRSLSGVDVHAVWDPRDPAPWAAELALLPYLMVKRGF